ncbi:hypothetical protein [Saccharothrix sp. NRRL B-16348]|uniref:hypothetical protein n=1 Tax=Saccharothrix sp. NRRL B-16348 TaxID=1415542 RepID=UPI000AD42E77|nr:hypothetical protein [Saccharothrix sp. NRRL B-16348]
MEKVLKGARSCMTRGRADNAATLLLHLWSETPDAAGLRETSLELADRFPLDESAAEVLRRAAVTSAERGRLPVAEELARRALGVWRARCQADPTPESLAGHVSALDLLASVHRARGEVAAVAACLAEVVEWQYDHGDRAGVAWALRELGVLAIEAGDLALAGTRLTRAVALYRERADEPSMRMACGECWVLLACVRWAEERPTEARALLEAALGEFGDDDAALDVLRLLEALDSGSELPESVPVGGEFGQLSWA